QGSAVASMFTSRRLDSRFAATLGWCAPRGREGAGRCCSDPSCPRSGACGMQLKTLNGEVAKLAARGEAPTRGLSNVLASDTSIAYAFIAPAFFLLLFLVAYPFVLSLWFSLSDARVGDAGTFVGLDNFRRLLSSGIFQQTLQNSMVFTAAALTAKTVFGMALALLL